jgi:hypothetical protein
MSAAHGQAIDKPRRIIQCKMGLWIFVKELAYPIRLKNVADCTSGGKAPIQTSNKCHRIRALKYAD